MSPGLESCHALVLNADFRPLSYFPLSIWSWQDAVKAVFLDRVSVISAYERKIHSPSFEMKLPSVIALKEYVPQARRPAFTRFNVFLRDRTNGTTVLVSANLAGDSSFCLVNNAGISVVGPLELVSVESWREQLEVNVVALRLTECE